MNVYRDVSLYIPYCDYLIRVLFNANFVKTRKMALLNTRNNNIFTTHNASQHQSLRIHRIYLYPQNVRVSKIEILSTRIK